MLQDPRFARRVAQEVDRFVRQLDARGRETGGLG